MKKFTINTSTFRNLIYFSAIFLCASCNTHIKSAANNEIDIEIQNSIINKKLLTGSWKEVSESALDFTLFDNGTARSDNMKTLLYQKWKVNGNKITFTTESIGNGTSSTNEETFIIDTLTENDLILKKGTYVTKYTKK